MVLAPRLLAKYVMMNTPSMKRFMSLMSVITLIAVIA